MMHTSSDKFQTFGQRLRALRGYCSLTRKHVEKKYQIPEITLKSWEFGRMKEITPKSIEKILSVFEEEGFPCTEEWLMLGKGASPFSAVHKPSSKKTVELEQEYFESINKGSLTFKMDSRKLEPHFEKGDILGGITLPLEKLSKKLGRFFLFLFADGRIVPGKLAAGSQEGAFSIIQDINLDSKASLMPDAKFTKAYEVLWVRKS